MINRSHFSHSLLQIRNNSPRANDVLAVYQYERGILALVFNSCKCFRLWQVLTLSVQLYLRYVVAHLCVKPVRLRTFWDHGPAF